MPFQRHTLSQLRQQAAADITTGIPGADGLLRFSNLQVISSVVAGFANLQYGYLDWIAQQAVPFTSTDEFLQAWGALKDVNILDATTATGTATFTGVDGTVIPSGTSITRSDSFIYTTTADGTLSGGTVTVPAIASVAGVAGNCDAATILTLSTAIPSINSTGVAATAFIGGADVETQDNFRTRVLDTYQNPPHGGSASDYVLWALAVNGVTRAWTVGGGMGLGTVTVYFMMDVTESAFGGFPQGSDGVATDEPRDVAATGDQLTVANAIYELQPVTPIVYAVAPAASPKNFIIAGLLPNTTAMRTSVAAAIVDCFYRKASPGGTVYMADIQASIDSIPGIVDFIITSPTTDITTTTGNLATLGTITWA